MGNAVRRIPKVHGAVLYLYDVDSDVLEEAFGDASRNNCPVFLIGQLARGAHGPKGAGSEYLNLALSYIATASNIIGGKSGESIYH